MFHKVMLIFAVVTRLTGQLLAQEGELAPWRILIADQESGTVFWLYPDTTREVIYTGLLDFSRAYTPALSADLQYLAYVDTSSITLLHFPTGKTTGINRTDICTECGVNIQHQVGVFSPDNRQWAVGFVEDSNNDVLGGIAIFDVETGELVTVWRLSHAYFADENPRYLKSVYVGGWNDDGILFFTWCRSCDSPVGAFSYDRWNPLTNEVSPTNQFYDSLDEIDILASTNEVIFSNTDRRLPFIREYYDLANVLEYWANGYQLNVFTDRPVIFHNPMYNDLRNPIWIMNGDAIYLRAGAYAPRSFETFRTLIIFRDGRQIQTNLVEENERALHGTPDGWLSVSERTDTGQQLYAYHVSGEQISREDVLFLTPQMNILSIDSNLRPQQTTEFPLATLPPAMTCSNWQGSAEVEILLQEGTIGRVISESPLPITNQPFGDAVAEIPAGAEFEVWDGPVCAGNGSAIWLIEYAGSVGWISERDQESDGLIMIEPVNTPTFNETCPGFLPSRLVVGQRGRVTPGDANNVRSIPHSEGRLTGQIPGEGVFQVLQGPICYNETAYWKVNYHGLIGWTSEGQGNTYWLEPIPHQ